MVMHALSALADSAFLLPLAVAVLAMLGLRRQWAGATAFAASLAACASATLLAKLVFNACGATLTDLDLISPSGHASLATTMYGVLAILAVPRSAVVPYRLAIVGAACLAVGVGVSRVALGHHSVAEIVFGWAIGAGAVVLFATLHERAGRPILPSGLLIGLGGAAAILLLTGGRFTPEHHIASLARRMAVALDVCADAGGRHSGGRHSGLRHSGLHHSDLGALRFSS